MYDAIIVGARCAGAPTAMLLARKGYRVLLVDKATFPSDTISTHIIWPHGAEIMDRWGLLDRLAATGCPPVALNLIFDVGPFALKGGVTDTNAGRGGFCPRRTVLDKLLVDAAVEAGAELREGFTVEALLWDGDRVAGIKGHSRTGGAVEERARVVIGADGVHSLVAKSRPRAGVRREAAAHHELLQLLQRIRGRRSRGVRPRLPGRWLLPDARRSHPHRGAVAQQQVRRDTRGHRGPRQEGARVHAERRGPADRRARREEKWVGTAGVPNYFRQPFGPGWALVGDAGYDKDPITAQGISDAFIDAEALTTALDDGWSGRRPLGDALAEYQASRDQRAKPMYDFTCQLATLEPPPPLMQRLFAALRGNQEATNQFYSAITGSRPLPAFMNPENLDRIMASAGARG